MSREKRQSERGSVSIDEPDIVVFLKTADGLFAINRIFDISLTGIGVGTRYRIDSGERVVLRYLARHLRLSIPGTVAWCRTGETGDYTIGIAFDKEDRESGSLLLLALRRYLDDGAMPSRLPSC